MNLDTTRLALLPANLALMTALWGCIDGGGTTKTPVENPAAAPDACADALDRWTGALPPVVSGIDVEVASDALARDASAPDLWWLLDPERLSLVTYTPAADEPADASYTLWVGTSVDCLGEAVSSGTLAELARGVAIDPAPASVLRLTVDDAAPTGELTLEARAGFLTTPPQFAVDGMVYTYEPQLDWVGIADVTLSVEGPAGMALAEDPYLISYTPVSSPETVTATVKATVDGRTLEQELSLEVLAKRAVASTTIGESEGGTLVADDDALSGLEVDLPADSPAGEWTLYALEGSAMPAPPSGFVAASSMFLVDGPTHDLAPIDLRGGSGGEPDDAWLGFYEGGEGFGDLSRGLPGRQSIAGLPRVSGAVAAARGLVRAIMGWNRPDPEQDVQEHTLDRDGFSIRYRVSDPELDEARATAHMEVVYEGLSIARNGLRELNCAMPEEQKVLIHDFSKTAAGATNSAGLIHLSSRWLRRNYDVRDFEAINGTIAHEMTHVAQREMSGVDIFVKPTVDRWWVEATATYGEDLLLDTNDFAEDYAPYGPGLTFQVPVHSRYNFAYQMVLFYKAIDALPPQPMFMCELFAARRNTARGGVEAHHAVLGADATNLAYANFAASYNRLRSTALVKELDRIDFGGRYFIDSRPIDEDTVEDTWASETGGAKTMVYDFQIPEPRDYILRVLEPTQSFLVLVHDATSGELRATLDPDIPEPNLEVKLEIEPDTQLAVTYTHKPGSEPWFRAFEVELVLADCDAITACGECTASPLCVWCTDTDACVMADDDSCTESIEDPAMCPVDCSAERSCGACERTEGCFWCDGLGCFAEGDACANPIDECPTTCEPSIITGDLFECLVAEGITSIAYQVDGVTPQTIIGSSCLQTWTDDVWVGFEDDRVVVVRTQEAALTCDRPILNSTDASRSVEYYTRENLEYWSIEEGYCGHGVQEGGEANNFYDWFWGQYGYADNTGDEVVEAEYNGLTCDQISGGRSDYVSCHSDCYCKVIPVYDAVTVEVQGMTITTEITASNVRVNEPIPPELLVIPGDCTEIGPP